MACRRTSERSSSRNALAWFGTIGVSITIIPTSVAMPRVVCATMVGFDEDAGRNLAHGVSFAVGQANA